MIAVVKSSAADKKFSDLENINVDFISDKNIIIEPSGVLENFGCEDPRVAYRPSNKLYYIYYTGV